MYFDITTSPPTPEMLAAEAKTLKSFIAKEDFWLKVTKVATVSCAAIFIVHQLFLLASDRDMTAHSLLAALVTAGVFASLISAVVVALLSVGIFPALSRSRAALFSLETIDPSDCPRVLDWCKEHTELALYQSQVAELGRSLVAGEVSAMKRWVDEIAARLASAELESKKREACEQLKTPMIAAT